jgi:predicted 3-demethylubiquinone-9 3-methyltransferase (glyoxalase superfamily)
MENTIYPCLWFNGNARQAADHYCSVFNNTKVNADNQMVVTFESAGQKFMCLNGGPGFAINPSISFFVVCETEKEVDETWNKLLDGGSALMPLDKYDWSAKYGWVQDKFGVSWQLSLGKMEDVGQKFTPLLMFTGNKAGKAEEAIGFYTSVFDNSGITGIARYEKGDPDVEGTVKHGQFNLGKYVFMAMDSSFPHKFEFNEAISLVVECEDQKEIDYYWNSLTKGGEESQCGWLKDKYGVWWQIIPSILEKLMSDPSRSERIVKAFLQMKKFDIETLVNA